MSCDDRLVTLGRIIVGTAGWSIPRAVSGSFRGDGSHLERYSRVLDGAEINSSFHRSHAPKTYERWAASTPASFRFSVKVPRTITHDGELRRARPLIEQFLQETAALGPKLGALLVQLPPSLAYNARVAGSFFDILRARHGGPVVCEPRHPTWFEPAAERLLMTYRVSRVATDPSRIVAALQPAGWFGAEDAPGVVYYRLHGSPRKYWSRYSIERVRNWASELSSHALTTDVWCIFDNTASGAAIENAIEMTGALTVNRTGRDLPP